MLFMISYQFQPGMRKQAQERFKKTGGMPPSGVRMLGRWHAIGA
jgi:hypothetical protein